LTGPCLQSSLLRLRLQENVKVSTEGQSCLYVEFLMEILSSPIENYLQELLPQRDSVLTDMERIAKEKGFPIIGPLVGRLLCQLARLTQARRIFELGSGYGYSAVWFSKGMPADGRIISTDGSAVNARMARQFFGRAGIVEQVDFRVGDALTLLDREAGPFDLILNDIDKHEYPQAFERAIPKLRKGGLLITDNVLWHGRVVSNDLDPSTVGVLKFNELAYHSSEVYTTIIPLRDGVALSLKL
jgi:caffeoyl-CoA O-methyltransferase